MFRAIKNNIPNAITCLNLLCGTLAIIAAFSPYDELLWGLQGYQVASIMIGLAAVADFADGFVARLLGASSPMGKELDSLCDCVSFGLAPAMILYNQMQAACPGHWLCYATLAIPVFGALRLARFNIDTNQSTTFTGLPIPANAIFFVGFAEWYAHHASTTPWVPAACAVAMSLLMVCSLRMFSLKMHSLSPKENYRQYLLVVAAVALVVTQIVIGQPWVIALAWIILFYVLLSAISRVK